MSVIQKIMKNNSTKHSFLLIVALTITPFIIFLGKNSSQISFFTATYFWVTFFYCLLFICAAIGMLIFSKKNLVYILFFAYFGFLQFYFLDIQQFFLIFRESSNGYFVLFFLVLVSLIAAFISHSSIFRNFVLILLSLNIMLSVINLIPVISKSLQAVLKTNNTVDNFPTISSLTLNKYPNIFYIVPDGLASPKILKDYVDIDFKESIKEFEKKNFAVSMHNYSSYNMTYLSLAALFKMDYPVTEKSLNYKYKKEDDFYPGIREKNPKLVQYLKKNNYKFVIFPPLWGGCPSLKDYKCLTPTSKFFLLKFFQNQDYAVSVMFQNSFLKKLAIKFVKYDDMNDSGKTAIKKMKINPEIWSDGGVFTMIHMLMPHRPYRNEDCSITNRYEPPSQEGYRSTVYCTFNRIHELSDLIIKNYPNATIVIQSDHGVYTGVNDKNKKFTEISDLVIDSRIGIFTAVRGCGSNQAAKLNQVNIVEYIIECLVNGTQTKKFKNKSFFGFYEHATEFGKVFRVR